MIKNRVWVVGDDVSRISASRREYDCDGHVGDAFYMINHSHSAKVDHAPAASRQVQMFRF